MKKQTLTIISATEYEMQNEQTKDQAIANWLHRNYAQYTTDQRKIKEIKKKANGQPTYREGDKIYLVP